MLRIYAITKSVLYLHCKTKQVKELLKNIIIKKAQVKHALSQYRIMMNITGLDYEKEINQMLDELLVLNKLEKELREKIKHTK